MKNSSWLQTEQWFMRGIGAGLLLTAALGGFFGILNNPNNDVLVRGMNIVMALFMAGAGALALWWSGSMERISKMLEGIKEQGAGTSRILAVVQTLLGALFLLDGLGRMGIVMILLGAMILISAAFFFWRSQQISQNA